MRKHAFRLLRGLLLVVLIVPAYPAISAQIFRFREPTFLMPLETRGPIQIREDPYGSGVFGASRNGGRSHRGVDLVARVGTLVLASKSGTAWIGRRKNGMGRYIEMRHSDGSKTVYGHLKKIFIRDRQRVQRGHPLGTVGKSGNAVRRSIQPHLHFEVWNENGIPVDPLRAIKRENQSS